MNRFGTLIAVLLVTTATTGAFSFQETSGVANHRRMSTSSALLSANTDYNGSESLLQERRCYLRKLAVFPAAVALLPFLANPAIASGGATAGGAYLLSAKQRYNERVKASVQGLLSAAAALKKGDSNPAKEYFGSEEGGSWKDLTAAGYLLSNAFRRNSSAAPDSLPAVKVRVFKCESALAWTLFRIVYLSHPNVFLCGGQKYKAFAAAIADLQKALKKKGATAASDEFPKVEAALNDWLNEIELPVAGEL